MEKFKQFVMKYRHAWVLLYALIYMPWFTYLEKTITKKYYLIYSPLDDYIPFVEYFVIPYLLWFLFMLVYGLYFFFTDTASFYKLAAFLCTGMTIFLIVCSIFPNGQNLRPEEFARDNLFVGLVKKVYETDTPTNVLPSIHVFNSIGICVAVAHSKVLKEHRFVQYFTYFFAVLIMLSTVFLKQHSILDMIAAIVMACIIYPFVYVTQEKKASKLSQQMI
ncbi:MAG: phosphatase PAP2 family protein [Dorea sp.]